MENDNDLKSHHLTAYGKALRTNLLQLLRAVHLVVQSIFG
jgi:hypothetical protein